eukprot:TRINITY_DN103546_c0_g1_i1.p1 TRINITY_DN103546_c0_g1~~TRINITY_DN103546_c0_g1_i1.p1  ORF type:complete len:194 (-),score=23.49 TRINITY_DN103546_c0_g1_i1:310-891(-)
MWPCSLCGSNPFALLLEHPTVAPGSMVLACRERSQRSLSRRQQESANVREPTLQDRSHFECRSDIEIACLVDHWEAYVHERSQDFFEEHQDLHKFLSDVAGSIDRHADPVLGANDSCVHWYGDVMVDQREAGIFVTKTRESSERMVSLNRTLAYVFAADRSFAELWTLPRGMPFKMACGNQLCCKLTHIALAV